MQRTVVTIGDQGGALTAKLMKADAALPNPRQPEPLGFSAATLPPLDSPANLKAYGESVLHGLMQHQAIRRVLEDMFIAGAGAHRVLCFDIEAAAGEQIRWETLCDDGGTFLALGGNCHIGRIAEEVTSRQAGVRPFQPPLRVAAFLSAIGVAAISEWDALSAAIDAAVAGGLPVVARVYIGERTLLEDIVQAKAGGAHPAVDVTPMPANANELERVINQWQPQVVHFFCHGTAGMGAAFLQLATLSDHELNAPSGSIVLAVDEMVNLPGLRDAWLVVLNCCEGGQATERLNSMAYRMVSRGGLAAAIGMQEPVAAGDANQFCAAFYPELFDVLGVALKMAEGAAPVAVNFSQAITAPRRALRNLHLAGPDNARWTLPVLYLQDSPFEVFRPQQTGISQDDMGRLSDKAELVAGFLRSLPPDSPEAVRDLLLANLDKPPVVPQPMRPDRYGTFPSNH
jgi:hypothetical protein